MMSYSTIFGPALTALAVQSAAAAVPDSETTSISPSPRVVQGDFREGRHEACLINPPLLLAAKETVRIQSGVGYELNAVTDGGDHVSLIAFGPRAFFEDGGDPLETVTISIDMLSLSAGKVNSLTGQAWKLFDQVAEGAKARLIPKSLQFSLCKHNSGSLAAAAHSRARLGALRKGDPGPRGSIAATLGAAAASVLDIFGLGIGSFVRVRLSSDPTDAEVYLGGARQPPKTNTVLDVVAAELPHLRLQKPGFRPCPFIEWKTAFESQNKRILNASCKLTPSITTPH